MAYNAWRELCLCVILLVVLVDGHLLPHLSDCGKSVGCLRNPTNCTEAENCTSFVRWQLSNDSNYLSFDLVAVTDGWVAVGLSLDTQMGDDSVVECIRSDNDNGSIKFGFSRNYYRMNEPYAPNNNTQYLKGENGAYVNGTLICQFQRLISGDNNGIFSLNDSYYLLLGYGPANAGSKAKHDMTPQVSAMRVNVLMDFMDVSNPMGNSTPSPPTPAPPVVYPCSQSMNCVADGNGNEVTFAVLPGTNQLLINMTISLNDSSGWFGLGFSDDKTMANDCVIDCILTENGTMIVKHSFNGFHYNEEISNAGDYIDNVSLSNENGLLQCLFQRQISGMTTSQIFSLDKPYYLFLAHGPVRDEGRKKKHVQAYITPDAILVTSNFSFAKEISYFADGKGKYVAFRYLNDSDEVEFEVEGQVNEEGRWIALGFSSDTEMGNDSCLDCILLKNGTIIVQHSYNADIGNSNSALNSSEGITLIDTSYKNGTLTCYFKRKVSGFMEPRIYSLDQPYYLLLGGGPVDDNGYKTKHEEAPVVSERPVDVRMVGNVTRSMGPEMTSPSNTTAFTEISGMTSPSLSTVFTETPGMTSPFSPPAVTATPAPSNWSNFTDPAAKNEVLFKLSQNGTEVSFTIRGPRKLDGGWWISVGFSDDQYMGNDSVFDCIWLSNGSFRLLISYNKAGVQMNEEVGNPDSAISDVMTEVENGVMTCNFKRKISGFTDPRVFPFTQNFYLLLACGPVRSDATKGKHDNYPFVSERPVDVRVFNKVTSPLSPSASTSTPGMTSPSNTPVSTSTPGMMSHSSSPASTATPAPSGESRFFDEKTNNEVLFKLSENGTEVNFTIRGPMTEERWWISVGFSDDQSMGNDSVLDCISLSNGTFRVLISYNPERVSNNEEVGNPDSAISDVMTEAQNGYMTCNFKRKISGFTDSRVFPFTQSFYLLLACGPVRSDTEHSNHKRDTSTGSKAKHVHVAYSSFKYNITTTDGARDSGGSRSHSNAPDPVRLLRAHGVLMITAFVMLMSGAIILARYYKNCWPENKICGTAVWFAVHRFLMVIGLFCCASGFIIIFCYGDGYLYRSFSSGSPSYFWVHGPLGIIVMILIIINPIMAIFRCDPDHDSRWIYNWLHFIVGTSCQILAGITLFFGIKMGELYYNLNHLAVFWILIAFVAFHCFIEIVLIIEKLVAQRMASQSFTVNYGMTTPGEEATAVKESLATPTQKSLMFRYFVIAVYGLITLGLWLAMIILIGGSFHTESES